MVTPTYRTHALLTALVILALSHLPVAAQVRNEPTGNTRPDTVVETVPPTTIDPDQHEAHTPIVDRDEHKKFAQGVDLGAFRRLAVSHGGRIKIIDTLAREYLARVYGKARWRDDKTGYKYDPLFTYLDLLFNQRYYLDKPIIYVEVLDLRRQLLRHLPEDLQQQWLKLGRLTPHLLAGPEASAVAAGLDADLTMHNGLRQVRIAIAAFQNPGATLLMVSPPAGDDRWTHLFELGDDHATDGDATAAPIARHASADPLVARLVREQFTELHDAWLHTDTDRVNAALRQLAGTVPRLNPDSYPSGFVRNLEAYYNATEKFTVGHWAYFAGMILLLIAFGAQRPWLIRAGIGGLALGFAIHTAGLIVRMILAGRWPIHNQFESYMAITWFATLVGGVLMLVRRQWLFGAAASALGGCALLLANTYPIPSHDVGQVAGILATSRILYIHVNMVLASYGLIALGFFVSTFYLAFYHTKGRATAQYAAAGLGITGAGDAPATLPGRRRLLNDLDRAQMVLLQLAFWILGVGVLMGAYWADHAWGRWWAWDPKETWALITWIIYLIVVHVRITSKNRGLVTAWLSVLGFVVMLWTYWGVNLLLAGLHSYA